MLCIIQEAKRSNCVTLKVGGRIASSGVGLIEHKCRACMQNNRTVVLNFSQVTFIDARGLAMLKRLASPRLLLINRPPCSTERQDSGRT